MLRAVSLLTPVLVVLPRVTLLLLLFATLAVPQQSLSLFTLPDITGAGSAVQLATSGTASWCQMVAPLANGSVVRWGDASISSSRGAIIPAGYGQFMPPGPGNGGNSPGAGYVFQLSSLYVLVQSGDKLTVTCARAQ